MPTLAYMYDVNQTVYNIDVDHGIREAVVKKIEVTMIYGVTTIEYSIAFVKPEQGSTIVLESTLFPNPEAAWDAYRTKFLR